MGIRFIGDQEAALAEGDSGLLMRYRALICFALLTSLPTIWT